MLHIYFSYTLALIGLGILTAGLSYVASIFYLYLHYEVKQSLEFRVYFSSYKRYTNHLNWGDLLR